MAHNTLGRDKRHRLDQLSPERLSRRVMIFQPSRAQIDCLMAEARASIGTLGDASIVHSVVARNPDAFWAIARATRPDGTPPEPEGFLAVLFLNEDGMVALSDGTLSTSAPDLQYVARQHEKPAGIYYWAFYAPGLMASAAPLLIEKMSSPMLADVDIYGRPATSGGTRIMQSLGFGEEAEFRGSQIPGLQMFRRSSSARAGGLPPYESYEPGISDRAVRIKVARSVNDFLKVSAIRAAVYLAEQDCPFDEEFDGNDLSATHLLAYFDSEPIGCLRLRWFAGFAKLERLAVRHEYRERKAAVQLMKAGIELCRMKGYSTIYGQSQTRLLGFYEHLGFRPIGNGAPFAFSDFDYTEIVLETVPHPEAITLNSGPYAIIRPEGRWHTEGILERSAKRPVTRPTRLPSAA